jgi:hypothetical protein
MGKNTSIAKNLSNVAAPKGQGSKAAAAVKAAAELAVREAKLENPVLALVAPPTPAPTPTVAVAAAAIDPMDAIELGETDGEATGAEGTVTGQETGTATVTPTPTLPAGAAIGREAAQKWLRAKIAADPGGPGAPWRHAGSLNITRMGLEALARLEPRCDSGELHRKYLDERNTFWGIANGGRYLAADGTVHKVGRASRTSDRPASGESGQGDSTPAVTRTPREALAAKVEGLLKHIHDLRDSLVDHRTAGDVKGALMHVAMELGAVLPKVSNLPEDWGHKPREAAQTFTFTPGQSVVIPEGKLREQCVSEGLVDAEDAAETLTIKSVVNDKVAVVTTATGARARVFTRFLRPAGTA